MNSSPYISVLMPVYNAERHLASAIKSILSQTFTDFELVLIDDGSKDNSLNIMRGFKDKRIRIIHQEKNLGLIETLNAGLSLCKGKYLARMDADDVAHPSRFQMQKDFLDQNNDYVACGTWYRAFGNKRSKYFKPFSSDASLKTNLLFNACFNHPTVMMRMEVINKNHLLFNSNFLHAEDYAFWINLSQYGKFALIEKPLLNYREHAAQVSKMHNSVQHASAEKLRKKYITQLGISFTEENLSIHQLYCKNFRFEKKEDLQLLETWFIHLISENQSKKIIEESGFNKMIGKHWWDACGNTKLGLKAFSLFVNSPLAKYFPMDSKLKIQLTVKCLLRALR